MIFSYLERLARTQPEQLFLITPEQALSCRTAFQQTCDYGRILSEQIDTIAPRIVLHAPNSAELLLLLLATDHLGLTACLIRDDYNCEYVELVAEETASSAVVSSKTACLSLSSRLFLPFELFTAHQLSHDILRPSSSLKPGNLILLTTGTTGKPKGVLHTWDKLLGPIRQRPELEGKRWLLSYNISHFAGIQLFLHGLCNGGTIVLPSSLRPEDAWEALVQHQIEYASGTPTFWRLLLSVIPTGDELRANLRQITLGGEASTPDLLEQLRTHFPQARITQVFATTETGPAFSVTDGLPGFPAGWLEKEHNGIVLRIVDDELQIRSAHSMEGYVGAPDPRTDGWHRTGDIVSVENGRVLFSGRRTDMVNVGGVKVNPATVEATILTVKGVIATRVYGQPNSVTGQVVVADIVIDQSLDAASVQLAVRRICRSQLNAYSQPRLVNVVTDIATVNQKIIRR